MYKSIVVGTDGSPTASEALRQATGLAKVCEATLHIVTAFRPVTATGIAAVGTEVAAYTSPEMLKEMEQSLDSEVQALLGKAAADAERDGVKSETYAVAGDAAEALMEVAENREADLIVVGNRGMSGAKRFILGSVPNKVSHHAPCNVLIVQTSG